MGAHGSPRVNFLEHHWYLALRIWRIEGNGDDRVARAGPEGYGGATSSATRGAAVAPPEIPLGKRATVAGGSGFAALILHAHPSVDRRAQAQAGVSPEDRGACRYCRAAASRHAVTKAASLRRGGGITRAATGRLRVGWLSVGAGVGTVPYSTGWRPSVGSDRTG